MPVDRHQLIATIGAACDTGTAALFVGAGLSQGAGLPGWPALLEQPRAEADVPDIPDLPLAAEYVVQHGEYTIEKLQQHILEKLSDGNPQPTETHRQLVRLPTDQIWTTNYDPLLEIADPGATVVATDDEVRNIGATRRSIVKMHGSLTIEPAPAWVHRPVICRSDYERYDGDRPRTWALLRAAYLSRTFLFLGFGFGDPNIEILQRLARLHGTAARDRHLTILKRPSAGAESDDLRRHDLLVADLERSGVKVHEIEDYGDIDEILVSLVRRTRSPRVFISGSGDGNGEYAQSCKDMAQKLAGELDWELATCGDAGWRIIRDVAAIRREERTYEASKLTFHFRKKDAPAPSMEKRVGTAVFTDLEREELLKGRLDESRAMLVLGGGARTLEEAQWAEELGVGVIPLAASGGSARTYWEQHGDSPPLLGGIEADPATWHRLGSTSLPVAARAAMDLLQKAMYVPS